MTDANIIISESIAKKCDMDINNKLTPFEIKWLIDNAELIRQELEKSK